MLSRGVKWATGDGSLLGADLVLPGHATTKLVDARLSRRGYFFFFFFSSARTEGVSRRWRNLQRAEEKISPSGDILARRQVGHCCSLVSM